MKDKMKTSFQLVSEMNVAFGNPKGDPMNIPWDRVAKQALNIPDEVGEMFIALGGHDKYSATADRIREAASAFKAALHVAYHNPSAAPDLHGVRDASRDVGVFNDGIPHFMGIDGDEDMRTVIRGVMTRFIKDEEDKAATIARHAAKGVTEVYFEGEYPTMIMKSAVDQPDAPRGKFLKSASYKEFPFYDVADPAATRFLPRRQTISLMDMPVSYVGTAPLVHLADVRKTLVDANLKCVEWSADDVKHDPRFSESRYEPKKNTSPERFAAFARAEGIIDLKLGDAVVQPATDKCSVDVQVTYKTPDFITPKLHIDITKWERTYWNAPESLGGQQGPGYVHVVHLTQYLTEAGIVVHDNLKQEPAVLTPDAVSKHHTYYVRLNSGFEFRIATDAVSYYGDEHPMWPQGFVGASEFIANRTIGEVILDKTDGGDPETIPPIVTLADLQAMGYLTTHRDPVRNRTVYSVTSKCYK